MRSPSNFLFIYIEKNEVFLRSYISQKKSTLVIFDFFFKVIETIRFLSVSLLAILFGSSCEDKKTWKLTT